MVNKDSYLTAKLKDRHLLKIFKSTLISTSLFIHELLLCKIVPYSRILYTELYFWRWCYCVILFILCIFLWTGITLSVLFLWFFYGLFS